MFEDPFSKYDKKFAKFEPLYITDNIISFQCGAKFSESDDEIQYYQQLNLINVKSAEMLSEWLEITDI